MRNKDTITLCQVSLKRDIPLILKNHQSFKNFYKEIKIFVICPSKDLFFFKDKLDFDKFTIISEDELLSFQKFELIFIKVSENIRYKPEFKKRLSWYYQQILKISFMINFDNLKGYDTQRLFAFLSERYLSYWFKKNFRYKEANWVQLDHF